MYTRCNLNISVIGDWWEKQLGLPASASPEERMAQLEDVFPGLITFHQENAPIWAPDPNHGFTMARALGADIVRTSTGSYDVAPILLEQAQALTPPDYATNPAVQALRESITQTKAQYGKASNASFSGLLYMGLKLRGQDFFFDFYENQDITRHLVAVCTETLYRHLIFLKDTCGEIPYFVLGSCSNCMISPETYREFFLAGEAKISTLSSYLTGHTRAMGIHHCGTKVDAYLEVYSRIPELDMLEANWASDIDRATQMIPGLSFKPMLDPILLDEMSEEAVEQQLQRLLCTEAVVEIQAFDLTQFTPIQKIRRMLETVLSYNHTNNLLGYTRFFV